MARKDPGSKIEFDSPATIAELIEALEDLRARYGNDARIRVAGFLTDMSVFDGALIKTLTVDLGSLVTP